MATIMSFFLGAVVATAAAGPDAEPSPIIALAVTLCAVAVGVAWSEPLTRKGIAGLNTYTFGFYLDPAPVATFVAGDAVSATKLCRAFGYLWLMAKRGWTMGRKENLNKQGDNNQPNEYEVHFQTAHVLPGALEPAFSGDGYGAAQQAGLMRSSYDDQANEIISNIDNRIVVKGSFIVALTLGGVDISNELDAQIRIPVGQDANGVQYLNCGIANTNAQDGVYNNPFSTALGFATLGSSQSNTPVLIAGAETVRRIGGMSK